MTLVEIMLAHVMPMLAKWMSDDPGVECREIHIHRPDSTTVMVRIARYGYHVHGERIHANVALIPGETHEQIAELIRQVSR